MYIRNKSLRNFLVDIKCNIRITPRFLCRNVNLWIMEKVMSCAWKLLFRWITCFRNSEESSYFVTVNKILIYFPHSYRPSWYYQNIIYSPTDAPVSYLKKNNIKIYIKTAPTCFGVTVTPSSGSALIRAY